MRKAVWATDYDYRTDKCYQRPCCPECREPIFLRDDGKYHCINCGEAAEPDSEMLEWMEKRSETKTEMQDCPKCEFELDGVKHQLGCGGKACVEAHYFRNNVTLEWQLGWSCCKKCGKRIIV